MRYVENKQQSATLLRLCLPLMVRQKAAYHPVSYALWYEHLAGINPRLSAALTARLAANDPLNEDDAYRLYSEHISERDAAVLQTLQNRLHELLDETVQDVNTIQDGTGNFTQTLRKSSFDLTDEVSRATVREVIARLLSASISMESANKELSDKLEVRTKEIVSLTKQLDQAHTEATIDPLCGIKNRRGFEHMAQALTDSQDGLDGAALILLDVDHFKRVNDSFGHLFGDKVLRYLAQALQDNVKGRDVVARIGGEEFVLLLPQTPLAGAQVVAERIRAAIEQSRIYSESTHQTVGSITVSLGLALGERHESVDELLARADAALYSAKRTGRNRLCVSEGGRPPAGGDP